VNLIFGIIWAIVLAGGGFALGRWVGGVAGTIIIFIGFVLASVFLKGGWQMRGR
jgi:hypothetical protein